MDKAYVEWLDAFCAKHGRIPNFAETWSARRKGFVQSVYNLESYLPSREEQDQFLTDWGKKLRPFLRRTFPIIAMALMVFNASFSWAQVVPQGVSDKPTSTALSNVSGNCLAVNQARKTLTLDNTGGSINLGYCETDPATPATPCTAAIGTPPTTTLAAGVLHYWPEAPLNQFCFIAASGTPSITIKEGQ